MTLSMVQATTQPRILIPNLSGDGVVVERGAKLGCILTAMETTPMGWVASVRTREGAAANRWERHKVTEASMAGRSTKMFSQGGAV